MPQTIYSLLYVYSMFFVLQIAMTQRSLLVYFGSPAANVQLPPRAKREDRTAVLIYFRVNDRITDQKRQEAYNEAQKACATLFFSVPTAPLCEFVAVAQEMATHDREVRCLPHELVQTTVCTR